MAYALIQKELTPPGVEQLKRAFSVWPALTDIDAHTAAHDAFGILLRNLEIEQASLLQDALLKEAVETEVIEEARLPVIPPAKVIRQIEFMEEHLSMYDPMKRHFTVSWNDILLIAAGNVRLHEVRRVKTHLEDPQFPAAGISRDTGSGTRTREENHFHFLLEIMLADGVTRYSVTADGFDFASLGARVTPQLESNFLLLVRDLEEFAPHASLNQGAYGICLGGAEAFKYPSKAAFWEEMTWMLWRISQASGAAGAGI